MANTIKLRRSATGAAVPTTSQLALGELAMNTYDGKLFMKTDQSGTEEIVEIGAGGKITISSTTPVIADSEVGDVFWDSNSGNPYILYDDGNGAAQWVALVATASGAVADIITEGNTKAEVEDNGSDGHFKVTTEGTERVRVGPAGQIGVAGANYGTSGQVLESGGASASISWATPVKLDAVQTFTAAQTFNAGASDSNGNFRSVPQNSQTSAYTLVAGDAGKHISITTGGVTVPSGIFSVGDAVTIYNNSTSDQTITQGSSVTLRIAGASTAGNKTLAQYGLCTVLCVASNVFVAGGAGLS